jgi:DHA2 family multidrug resistance protein
VRELPQATGLSNFFRQLGGSFGIALMATLLTHYVERGRAVLAGNVSWFDTATRARVEQMARAFMSRGADAATAHQQALAVLDRQILGQANVLAFGKIYLLSGLILLISVPLVLLLKRPTGRGPTIIAE